MEWSIQEVAKLAGTTSRTLRHYNQLGLVEPSRIGANGYRYYNVQALVRLQHVLLLRELGLGLAEIGHILNRESDEAAVLSRHVAELKAQQRRLSKQVAAVEHTISVLQGKGEFMATKMFDGFDHTQYRQEVEQRWGARAYATSSNWWESLDDSGRARWRQQLDELNADWITAAQDSQIGAHSAGAQELAQRHIAWLRSVPGTPTGADFDQYVRGLAQMYVADDRFAANYGGVAGAEFVRDALLHFLDN